MKLLSLVFSFRNEENNLEELVNRTVKSINELQNWDYELIFVNDSSNDGSEKILLDLQKKFKIIIINMSRTFGIGPCVLAGFKNSSGDCVIYMDSDLQDPPELIPSMVKKFEEGNEIVHTVRENREGESRLKLLLTKIAYNIIGFFSDLNLPVEAGDFKLISKKALSIILEQKEFDPYVRGLSVWVGFKQTYVKYTRHKRATGKTHFSIFGKGPMSEFLRGITSYSTKPLYISIVMGLLGILMSIILIIYSIYLKLNNLSVPGSSGILITISFFSGNILISLGFLGVYIGKIFNQTKNRHQYIIKEIKQFK
jgi:polyisoprenyl-phosphate glycosyltransferase